MERLDDLRTVYRRTNVTNDAPPEIRVSTLPRAFSRLIGHRHRRARTKAHRGEAAQRPRLSEPRRFTDHSAIDFASSQQSLFQTALPTGVLAHTSHARSMGQSVTSDSSNHPVRSGIGCRNTTPRPSALALAAHRSWPVATGCHEGAATFSLPRCRGTFPEYLAHYSSNFVPTCLSEHICRRGRSRRTTPHRQLGAAF